MGAIRDFLFPAVEAKRPIAVTDVQAALTPVQISDSVYNILGGATTPGPGGSQNALATSLVTGGAGGGGKSSTAFASGGSINAASAILTKQVSGGVTSGQNGEDGYGTLVPFCGTGGAGGASSLTTSGDGGNGFYGCGGGGSGTGTALAKGGGNGGDGLVITQRSAKYRIYIDRRILISETPPATQTPPQSGTR